MLATDSNRVLPPGIMQPGSGGMLTLTTTGSGGAGLLHQVPTGRTAVLSKLIIKNRGAANSDVMIGDTDTGAAGGTFTQRITRMSIPVGGTDVYTADMLPRYEFNATNNVVAQISVASTVEITAEFEEIGG